MMRTDVARSTREGLKPQKQRAIAFGHQRPARGVTSIGRNTVPKEGRAETLVLGGTQSASNVGALSWWALT